MRRFILLTLILFGFVGNSQAQTPPSRVWVSDTALPEPDTGKTYQAIFTVSLDRPATTDLPLIYSTRGDSATQDVDFTGRSRTTVVIPKGEIRVKFLVPVLGDNTEELDETFTLTLEKPNGLILERPTGRATIQDNDYPGSLSITPIGAFNEGNSGSLTAPRFRLRLSQKAVAPFVVDLETQDITATAGSDYTPFKARWVFAPGETSKSVSITTFGDLTPETNEVFSLKAHLRSGSFVSSQGTTIINDDAPQPLSQSKIAFATLGVRGGIGVSNADGTGGQILLTSATEGSDELSMPHFSGDGSKLVYTAAFGATRHIFVANADATSKRQLTFGQELHTRPKLSRDGAKIVFNSFSSTNGGQWRMSVMNADGTGRLQLAGPALEEFTPSFTPDNTRILFAATKNGVRNVYSLGIDGTNEQQLTRFTPSTSPFGQSLYDPILSPDGARLYFAARQSGEANNIWTANADGTACSSLTRGQAAFFPALSPDGPKIVYYRSDAGNSSLFLVDVNGANNREFLLSYGITYPTWAPGTVSSPLQTTVQSKVSGNRF